MSCGAQPTSKVAWLLGKAGILPEQPRPVPVQPRRTFSTTRSLMPICGAVGEFSGEFRIGDLVTVGLVRGPEDDLDY